MPIATIDEKIRTGQIAQARDLLLSFKKKAPRRADLSTLANFAARLGLPELGLKWLRPVVRGTGKKAASPLPAEIAEYALCLLRLEAAHEAKRLLETLSSKEIPVVDFYLALTEVAQWEYARAIPLLERYADNPGITPYQKQVANVNLIAALIFERQHDLAESKIDSLVRQCKNSGRSLLLANLYELSTANLIYRREYEKAKKILDLARNLLEKNNLLDSLFVAKWSAILALREGSGKELVAFRLRAAEARHWESVRECDRFEAVFRRDVTLLQKVFFGTPFPRYRQSLLKDFGEKISFPDFYEWRLGEGEGPTTVDLLWWSSHPGPKLRTGDALHRTFQSLGTDFYRPANVATLHERLFPGQYFNTESSPKRIHTLMKRLRQWFKAKGLPFAIAREDGAYRLSSRSPISVVILSPKILAPSLPPQLSLLKHAAGKEAFGLKWATERSATPPRTMTRLLSDAVREGIIERYGKGRATKYRFQKN